MKLSTTILALGTALFGTGLLLSFAMTLASANPFDVDVFRLACGTTMVLGATSAVLVVASVRKWKENRKSRTSPCT